ncbi:MAG: hypothetical protein LBO65_07000 [Spirochaetaceae bacterium]|jgi:hypothetical protein|nr:hypothetical protein [Spirochaetaceae bacterium]
MRRNKLPWGLLLFFLGSCSTLGFQPAAKGWPVPEEHLGTAELGNIRVDKNADWDSVEAETRRILPLLLAEQGYGPGPEYLVDAVIIEREYMENWKTRRSLSAEIRIWKNPGNRNHAGDPQDPPHGEDAGQGKLPLSAGTALLSGNRSLSSSRMLHRLLYMALTRALRELEKK